MSLETEEESRCSSCTPHVVPGRTLHSPSYRKWLTCSLLGEFSKPQPFLSLIANSSVLSKAVFKEWSRVETAQLYMSASITFLFPLNSLCASSVFLFFFNSPACVSPLAETLNKFAEFILFLKTSVFPHRLLLHFPSHFPKHHSALPSYTEMGPGRREAEEWGGRDEREATVGKLNKWNKMFWSAGWSNCQEMSSGSAWNYPEHL